ncbi:MAG: phosphate ABC transporter substrate-binding protein [Calothrix sp. SM1_7_51]|nr:phosphate ABC transporter substrate-binding protein [Calothrix sp. SM1_7_51]
MTKGNKNQETLKLLLALLISVGLLGSILLFFQNAFFPSNSIFTQSPSQSSSQNPQQKQSQNTLPQSSSNLIIDTNLPNPSTLTIDGSVTMVALMKQLQVAYSLVNPSIPTTYGLPDGKPNGTNAGIKNLIDGKVMMAAISRRLEPREIEAGLVGIPIAKDALAVAIGINNPYKGGLTIDQLKGIFQGKITNWKEVGGPDASIKVFNRSADSGTQSFFRDVVLLGEPFAIDGANFITREQDETTPILQALGNNGISYSAVSQIANQKTVRIVPINGISPTDINAIQNGTYPIIRIVYLAVPKNTSPATKQFVDVALSARGKDIVQRVGFIPLK